MSKKLKHDEVKQYIEIVSGSGCELLSEYKGIFEQIEVKCRCENVFNTTFKNFRDGNKRKCNGCSGVKRYKYEDVKMIIEDNSNRKLLSETYKNSTSKLSILCECGEEFATNLNSFMIKNKKQCNLCGHEMLRNKLRKTTEAFTRELSELLGLEFTVVGEYTGAFNDISITHKVCNTTFTRTAKNLFRTKNKITCPLCDIYQYVDLKIFIENSGCKLLTNKEDYKNVTQQIEIQCYRCDQVFSQNFATFSKGEHRGCPKCYHIKKAEDQRFSDYEVAEIINKNGCKWLKGEYKNQRSKLLISCKECIEPYTTTMDKFIHQRKQMCNSCAKLISKGEYLIKEILDKNNLKYDYDIHLDGLNGIKNGRMRADFVIYKNDDICLIIEYDGAQHFTLGGNKKYYNDKQSFDERIKNDRLKNQYCLQRNISLVRIPYWNYNNMEHILSHVLGNCGLIHKDCIDKDLVKKHLVNHSDWSHEKYISQQIAQ